MANHLYEIEMKALLTKEQYNRLLDELPKKMKLLSKETLHTMKFLSHDKKEDIRLRYSDKTFELVFKNGHATELSRREKTMLLKSEDEVKTLAKVFELLNFEAHPPWKTHRTDFEYRFKGYKYNISLQHTENFAHILEVEFMGNKEDEKIHKPHIESIIKSLGCEPIDAEEFSAKIKKYIEENKK